MEEIRRWEILQDCKALIKGHFVFSSDRHGNAFLAKDAVSKDYEALEIVCWDLASDIAQKCKRVDVVVGPSVGAIKFSHEMARQLSGEYFRKVFSVYTEKDKDGNQIFLRGFENDVRGKKVLVVDDILTTGHSIQKVIKAVEGAGGKVVGIAIVVARHKVNPKDFNNLPIFVWLDLELPSWPEEICPLCKNKVPVNVQYGHGREFLEEQKKSRK